MPNPKKPRRSCPNCGKECKRSVDKFCDNHCQREFQYKSYIQRWLDGFESGMKGSFYAISGHIRRWIIEKYGEKCSICGWSMRHPFSGKVPLTIDHIDGDVANNHPENLRLLCNNCHSLTPTFGALNRGKGKRPNHKGAYFTKGPPSSVG